MPKAAVGVAELPLEIAVAEEHGRSVSAEERAAYVERYRSGPTDEAAARFESLPAATVAALSEPFPVTQEMIDQFADLTGDHQWIHVDVERAKKESPFGGPIAHGFLTLSLLPVLTAKAPDAGAFVITGAANAAAEVTEEENRTHAQTEQVGTMATQAANPPAFDRRAFIASVLREVDWPAGRSFYFHDPDGNLLEIADADIWPD